MMSQEGNHIIGISISAGVIDFLMDLRMESDILNLKWLISPHTILLPVNWLILYSSTNYQIIQIQVWIPDDIWGIWKSSNDI